MIVGQHDVIERLSICLFARGHALLMGVPGLAKTLLVSKVAETMSLKFSRIQFTPDLMPMDITGTDILQDRRRRPPRVSSSFTGPVFANIVLADEINRAPPKTQAAMLEAMQEHKVTVARQDVARWSRRFWCWPRRTRSSRKGPIRCPRRSWTASCS